MLEIVQTTPEASRCCDAGHLKDRNQKFEEINGQCKRLAGHQLSEGIFPARKLQPIIAAAPTFSFY